MFAPDCAGISSWEPLLAAALPPDRLERIERHLDQCPTCQASLDQEVAGRIALLQRLRQAGDPATLPDDPTLQRLRERLYTIQSPVRAEEGGPIELYFLGPTDRPGLLGTLGAYEVQEVIGQGGFGVVLKAHELALHRIVAIKVLSPALAGSANARKRFTREAKAAAAVCHENIVAVHAVQEAEGLPYLVMQYVAGESLQARLDRLGHLETIDVVRIGMQTATGLAAAHAQGLIHRDVKPANLLLEIGNEEWGMGNSGMGNGEWGMGNERMASLHSPFPIPHSPFERVKITDFGLARMVDDVQLTQNGVVAGTPEYMAPEQARGEALDPRADLFSLGSVLYAMCTGRPPFLGETTVGVLRQVSDQDPTPVRVLNPEVPAWLEVLIARLQAKDPADRLQSAAEVAALLEGYLAHLRQPETVPAPALAPLVPPVPAGTPARRGGPALRSGGLLLALALAALGLGGVAWLAAGGGTDRLSKTSPNGLYQDFRDKQPVADGFFLMGTDWEKYIAHEREGLRVSLPATRKVQRPMRGIGLGTTLPVAGDFQITATYELLSAGTPISGKEVAGVDIYIQRSPEGNRQARFGRFNTRQGSVYEMSDSHYKRAPDKVLRVPTAATKGQLRLVRAGSLLLYRVKDDTTHGEFKELYRTEFGTEPLKFILYEVNPGQEATPVEARLIDLRIESNIRIQAPPPANAPDPDGPPDAPGGSGMQWLVVAAVFGLFGIVVPALAGWLFLRRRRQVAAVRAGAPVQNEATPEATLFLSFACTGCGKSLKGKPALAGKKVKCPQCGLAVRVPDAQVGQSEPSPAAPLKKGKTPIGRLAALSLCLLVLVAVILWLTFAPSAGSEAAPSSQKESPKEFFQSFKGPAKDWQRWDLCGPDSNECVRFEPEGVHITLPRGFPGARPYTGLSTEIEVDGDLEITVHFEFLPDAVGQKSGNQYARFTLDAVPVRPGGINLSRSFEKNGQQFFGAWYSLPDEVTGKDKSAWKGVPTQTLSGRLRLVRKGNVVSFYVAEESQDNFVLIQEYAWTSQPLKEIRLVGWTGGPQGSLNVRICDFRLRADTLPNLLPSVAPTSFGTATVIVLLIIGFVIALGVLIGVWLWERRKPACPG